VGRGRAPEDPGAPRVAAGQVSIPSEVGRGRARMTTCAITGTSSASFNPLGGGAGSGSQPLTFDENTTVEFQSPWRWGGVGLDGSGYSTHHLHTWVSIPSEVGRGRAHRHRGIDGRLCQGVSIPSEVGRGRAPSWII